MDLQLKLQLTPNLLRINKRSVPSTGNMDIDTVNALCYKDFMKTFGNLVEQCPIIAAAVWSRRPFISFAALEAAIAEFIDALPQYGKEGLLRCLQDLGGREFQNGTLSQESYEEQTAAGMNALAAEETLRMARLNEEYKKRFGFPFVICARMNDKTKIICQLSERFQNERAIEMARSIEEVKKICHLRLQRLVLTV